MRKAKKIRNMLISFYKKNDLPFSKKEYKRAKRIYTSLNWKLKESFNVK